MFISTYTKYVCLATMQAIIQVMKCVDNKNGRSGPADRQTLTKSAFRSKRATYTSVQNRTESIF